MEAKAASLETVLQTMNKSGRTKVAITWDDQKNVEKPKEVAEEAATRYIIWVAIHVKLNSKGEATTRKIETEAILVRRSEKATYANTLRSVRDEVLARRLGDTIMSLRESKTGDLVLTVAKRLANKDKKSITKALQEKLGKLGCEGEESKAQGGHATLPRGT